MTREWQIRRALGEDGLTLTINPTLLVDETGIWPRQEKRLRIIALPYVPAFFKRMSLRIFWEMTPFFVEDGAFQRHPIRKSARFRLMKDVYDHRDNISNSQTYAMIRNQIIEAGAFSHKNRTVRRVDEIELFISDCYLDLIKSIEAEGYQHHKSSEWATGGTGTAFVDADGTIVKCAGATHRLAASILVGLEHGFPLRVIGIHRAWAVRNGVIGNIGKLRDELRALEATYRVKKPSVDASTLCTERLTF